MLYGLGMLQIISIHALFAEGDVNNVNLFTLNVISIHALFAEGDSADSKRTI